VFESSVYAGVIAERNMNPKAACLKRREEEKGTEFLTAQASSVYPDCAARPLVVRIVRVIVELLICIFPSVLHTVVRMTGRAFDL